MYRSRQIWKLAIRCITCKGGTNAICFLVKIYLVCLEQFPPEKVRVFKITRDPGFTSIAHPPRFCDRCFGLQGDRCPTPMDYRNVGPTAAWGVTNISHETYQVLDRRWMSRYMGKNSWVQFPHNLPWLAASCLPRNCPRLVCQWSLGNIVYSQVEIPFYTQACLCVNQSLYREVWGYKYTSII